MSLASFPSGPYPSSKCGSTRGYTHPPRSQVHRRYDRQSSEGQLPHTGAREVVGSIPRSSSPFFSISCFTPSCVLYYASVEGLRRTSSLVLMLQTGRRRGRGSPWAVCGDEGSICDLRLPRPHAPCLLRGGRVSRGIRKRRLLPKLRRTRGVFAVGPPSFPFLLARRCVRAFSPLPLVGRHFACRRRLLTIFLLCGPNVLNTTERLRTTATTGALADSVL
uniref:Uncharacterized protein n=1 Tax=Leishmania guyanensis TaxID=5670 RepID=A0A1E1IRV8_LEIGU|nr:Hypothetical protein BN36_1213040 [Leishmania guyanensis]